MGQPKTVKRKRVNDRRKKERAPEVDSDREGFGSKYEHESLILAQDERWRRA